MVLRILLYTLLSVTVMICMQLFKYLLSKNHQSSDTCNVDISASNTISADHIYRIIKKTTLSCLNTQFFSFIVIFSVAFVLLSYNNQYLGYGFLTGLLISTILTRLCAFVVLEGNYKTAQACSRNLSAGFDAAYSHGVIQSIFVFLGLLIMCIIYYWAYNSGHALYAVGIAFGISCNAFMSRISGGIYTKSCDVGADLLGKIDAQMDEDSIENPLFIGDNVGDNVGDAFAAQNGILEASAFAMLFIAKSNIAIVVFITTLFLVFVFTTILPSIMNFISKPMQGQSCVVSRIASIFSMTIISSLLLSILIYQSNILTYLAHSKLNGIYYYINKIIVDMPAISIWQILFIFLSISSAIMITIYYTYDKFTPIQNIAESTKIGYTPLNIIRSIGESLSASYIVAILLISQCLFEIWMPNTLILSVSVMIGLIPLIIATDIYGPIVDNAGGIAVSGKMSEVVRERTDYLDQMGNMSKALTKSYSAYLVSLACVIAISSMNALSNIITSQSILILICGALLGSASIFIFCGILMNAVDDIARKAMTLGKQMIQECKSSEHSNLALLVSNAEKLPVIIMSLAINKVTLLAAIVIAQYVPISVMLWLLGCGNSIIMIYALGLQIGSICAGLCMSVFMTTCGGAMDNVSKCLDAQYNDRKKELKNRLSAADTEANGTYSCNFDGKYYVPNDHILNEQYTEYIQTYSIVDGGSGGDIVGDPLKDTVGNTITSIMILTFCLLQIYIF